MNNESSTVMNGAHDETATRTDAQIEASIQTKVDAAVKAATDEGRIDPDKPVGVIIGADGSITVANVSDTDEPGIPDPVEFPAMYRDETRESLADSYYKDHLESHWGF